MSFFYCPHSYHMVLLSVDGFVWIFTTNWITLEPFRIFTLSCCSQMLPRISFNMAAFQYAAGNDLMY